MSPVCGIFLKCILKSKFLLSKNFWINLLSRLGPSNLWINGAVTVKTHLNKKKSYKYITKTFHLPKSWTFCKEIGSVIVSQNHSLNKILDVSGIFLEDIFFFKYWLL